MKGAVCPGGETHVIRVRLQPLVCPAHVCVCWQCLCGAFLVAQSVKNPPATQETRVRSLGREEWHGNPSQYSRPENPMNRGAWGPPVHRTVRVGHD